VPLVVPLDVRERPERLVGRAEAKQSAFAFGEIERARVLDDGGLAAGQIADVRSLIQPTGSRATEGFAQLNSPREQRMYDAYACVVAVVTQASERPSPARSVGLPPRLIRVPRAPARARVRAGGELDERTEASRLLFSIQRPSSSIQSSPGLGHQCETVV